MSDEPSAPAPTNDSLPDFPEPERITNSRIIEPAPKPTETEHKAEK